MYSVCHSSTICSSFFFYRYPLIRLRRRRLGCDVLQFRHDILAGALREVPTKVVEHAHFHLALRLLRLRAHVREERGLRELEQAGIYVWLIGEDVQTDGGELFNR